MISLIVDNNVLSCINSGLVGFILSNGSDGLINTNIGISIVFIGFCFISGDCLRVTNNQVVLISIDISLLSLILSCNVILALLISLKIRLIKLARNYSILRAINQTLSSLIVSNSSANRIDTTVSNGILTVRISFVACNQLVLLLILNNLTSLVISDSLIGSL